MRASSPTGFVITRGSRFPGWPRALPWFVGEGFIPPAGVCGGAGCGRDEGIPPYGHFIGSAYTGKAACFRRGVRGFPVRRGPAVVRRGGIYPSRGCSRRRGGCGRGHAPPLHAFRQRPATREGRIPARRKPIVGADSISARGVCGAARLPGRDESRPYEQILRFAPPGPPRRFPRFVGEGHGPPAGVCGGAGFAGRCQASSPTGVCHIAEVAVSRFAARPPPI